MPLNKALPMRGLSTIFTSFMLEPQQETSPHEMPVHYKHAISMTLSKFPADPCS
jgi:hypothetical protein